jgi:serpin B
MRNLKIIGLLILSIVIFYSCSEILYNKDDSPTSSLNSIPKSVTTSQNNFAFELLKNINREQPDSNIFISPISASLALTMTMNGAAGETYQEMNKVLGYNTADREKLNASCKALINELYELSGGIEFNLANSIWLNDNFTLQEDFKNLNEEYFNAKIEALDFSQVENCVDIINSWVEDKTKDRIKDLVNESDFAGPTLMFLINAIYFKASWKYQFSEEKTDESDFYLNNGDNVKCQMMQMKEEFNYYSNSDIQAIDLIYANENYSMTILLPRDKNELDSLMDNIDGPELDKIIDNFKKDSVNLFMPKLELDYKKELKKNLVDMGMAKAFQRDQADFSKMVNEMEDGIFIDKVRQKSFLKIEEKGTEAAAATVVTMKYTTSIGEGDEIYMRINHPFLFFIRERRTGTILFSGKIMEPKWED